MARKYFRHALYINQYSTRSRLRLTYCSSPLFYSVQICTCTRTYTLRRISSESRESSINNINRTFFHIIRVKLEKFNLKIEESDKRLKPSESPPQNIVVINVSDYFYVEKTVVSSEKFI